MRFFTALEGHDRNFHRNTGTVEPVLKATWFKRPPVYKDHFKFLPMFFSIKMNLVSRTTCLTRPATIQNRPKQHILPALGDQFMKLEILKSY